MKKIRYGVAMSLDGFIAGPNGEYDWIVPTPEFDFAALWAQFDVFVAGRKTYEVATAKLGAKTFSGKKVFVVSRSMKASHPGVTIVSELNPEAVAAIRAHSSKDIWLFGGGELFRAMLELGEVDGIEVSVIPVVLGQGIPFLPTPAPQTKLKLVQHKPYSSGMVWLQYEVQK